MEFTVVTNPQSGTSGKLSSALEGLDRLGVYEVVEVDTDDDLDRVISSESAQLLVLAGGDGTIHRGLNRMVALGVDRPVGLIPLGTGNDLARGLGIPLDPTEAAARLGSATARRLPAIQLPGGEVGINAAHVGLGVEASRRGHDWKPALGPAAYAAGTVVEGLSYDGIEVAVAIDGRTVFDDRALAVMVMLGPSTGGGFEPLEGVSVTGHGLDVLIIEAGGTLERLTAAWRAGTGGLEDLDSVGRHGGRTVTVRTGADQEWDVDGEFRTWTDPVDLVLSDDVWTVMV